jgi:hypothetical protein
MAGTWLEKTMQRGRGTDHFPHQLWFIMDNPVRGLLVNPRRLIDRLELSGSEDVLEVGPGPGLFSVEIARRLTTGRLELLELQPEMLPRPGGSWIVPASGTWASTSAMRAGGFRSPTPASTSPFSPRCSAR